MSLELRCDRCDVLEEMEDDGNPEIVMPRNWLELDGLHVCPECADAFGKFMKGEEIPCRSQKPLPSS